ncbi:1-deoxy-D-xylulose-5-phosphate synthase N-terminal domain-containing protein [Streptomyces sp. NPDC056716]|uniref:1-deoxy-D-xylulose-5-phosphate synthase N-terminal domain-containing protein n=1 Tax=unclassified Streptomyces TaxID=2593676 RepID=UPI0036D145E1
MGTTQTRAAPEPSWTVGSVERLATAIRLRAVQMVAPMGFGYLGQALSAAEQVAAMFARARPGQDRMVCSPGHYVIAPYAAMVELGLLDESALETYGQDGSPVEAIGTERSPLLDYTCGSLGQGLSAAAGFALGDRMHGSDAHTYALISDGEMEEGQLWEAAVFAAHHRLGALNVLLDANNSQVDGPVDAITTLEPMAAKWAAFGWQVTEVDGHDAAAVTAALTVAESETERPSVLICRTSTVHGLDCLPEDADGHFIKLPPALADAALAELTARREANSCV